MPSSSKGLDLNNLLHQENVHIDLNIKTPEDAEEKSLRLKKDFLSFVIKEIGPYALATVFIVAIGAYCFVALGNGHATADEKQWARATLSLILAGVVGVVFGKATK